MLHQPPPTPVENLIEDLEDWVKYFPEPILISFDNEVIKNDVPQCTKFKFWDWQKDGEPAEDIVFDNPNQLKLF